MRISKKHKELILSEIQFVIDETKKAKTVEEKLYLFSGIHTVVHRVFNTEYSSTLVFLHFVLQNVHSGFLQRIGFIRSGDKVVLINEEHVERLEELTEELKINIENDSAIEATMKRFVELVYSTTGNGNYLKRKGLFKL